jgi:hypothetical protein
MKSERARGLSASEDEERMMDDDERRTVELQCGWGDAAVLIRGQSELGEDRRSSGELWRSCRRPRGELRGFGGARSR